MLFDESYDGGDDYPPFNFTMPDPFALVPYEEVIRETHTVKCVDDVGPRQFIPHVVCDRLCSDIFEIFSFDEEYRDAMVDMVKTMCVGVEMINESTLFGSSAPSSLDRLVAEARRQQGLRFLALMTAPFASLSSTAEPLSESVGIIQQQLSASAYYPFRLPHRLSRVDCRFLRESPEIRMLSSQMPFHIRSHTACPVGEIDFVEGSRVRELTDTALPESWTRHSLENARETSLSCFSPRTIGVIKAILLKHSRGNVSWVSVQQSVIALREFGRMRERSLFNRKRPLCSSVRVGLARLVLFLLADKHRGNRPKSAACLALMMRIGDGIGNVEFDEDDDLTSCFIGEKRRRVEAPKKQKSLEQSVIKTQKL